MPLGTVAQPYQVALDGQGGGFRPVRLPSAHSGVPVQALHFHYAAVDGWNPPEFRQRWTSLFPRSAAHTYPALRHGVVSVDSGAVTIGEAWATLIGQVP